MSFRFAIIQYSKCRMLNAYGKTQICTSSCSVFHCYWYTLSTYTSLTFIFLSHFISHWFCKLFFPHLCPFFLFPYSTHKMKRGELSTRLSDYLSLSIKFYRIFAEDSMNCVIKAFIKAEARQFCRDFQRSKTCHKLSLIVPVLWTFLLSFPIIRKKKITTANQ